jgi:4'-phosphopantetheinyl transferase EntD
VERLHVRAATLRRRQEFSTGRALLRELLGRDVPIPVGSDRAPVLPPDVCASLAHDERFAVAAVAPRERVRSIGIDIEPAGPLANELTRLIVRDDDSPLDPRLTFVLKEATYKAWSGLGGRTLEFADVRVMAIGSRFWGDIIPESNRLTGTFASAAGRWLALVVVDNS